MKRIITTILTLMLTLGACLGMMTGCGKKRDPKVLNVFMFAQSHEQTIYKAVVKQFNDKFSAESGKTVQLVVGGDDYFTKLAAELSSGSEADVYYVQPGDVRLRVNLDQLVNLDTYFNQEALSDIYPQALDFFRYDGESNGKGSLYALPKDFSQYVLGFNTKLISDNASKIREYMWDWAKNEPSSSKKTNYTVDGTNTGVKPASYEEWSGLPYTIKSPDGNKGTVMVKLPGIPGSKIKYTEGGVSKEFNVVYTFEEFGALANICCDYTNNIYATAFWESMCMMPFVWGAGGEYLSEDGKTVTLNTPEAIEGQQGYYDLLHKWNTQQFGATDTGYQLFPQNKLVFYPIGSWDIGYFNSEAIGQNFDIMPWMIGNQYSGTDIEDRQNLWKARADSVGYGISKNCIIPDYAAKFIQYLTLDPSIQQYLVESGAQIPNNVSLQKDYLDNKYKFREPGGDLTDKNLAPNNKQLLIDVATGNNGHVGPSVYTYTNKWETEYLSDAADLNDKKFEMGSDVVLQILNKLTNTKIDITVKSNIQAYANSHTTRAQSHLDDAIKQEQNQKG